MASAKALAVSSSKRHPRIAVVTSPRRRRRHHRRIVVRAERCRIATRAERERSSPSSPRCRRSAVMPSRRPCLSPSSLPVSSSSPSSERRATPRRVVAASSHPRRRRRLYPYYGCMLVSDPPRRFEVAPPTLTRRWSALALPSARRRRCRHRCYHRGLFPAYSPAVVIVASSSSPSETLATSWFGSCRCPCSPVVVGRHRRRRSHRRRGQSPRSLS